MPKRLTRTESRQITRERLLTAAAELFSRQGFGATSVEDIAEMAGYSKGAFYANFPNKDELFLTLFDSYWKRMEPRWVAFFQEDASPQEQRRKGEHLLKQEITEIATKEGSVWTMLLLEFILYALRNEGVRRRLTDRYRQIDTGAVKLLEGLGREKGNLIRLSSVDRAWFLRVFSFGLAIQCGLDPEVTPDNAWLLPFAMLFGDTRPLQISHQIDTIESEEEVTPDHTQE
jgi:AcrR family transcriptional regulator